MTQGKDAHDENWMRLALAQAQAAQGSGEVPVGAVVVCNGLVLGVGRNESIGAHDPTAHAEMVALRAAAKHLGNYRLEGCDLYVTLEPCTMCAGAMLHSRLRRVVYGAPDPKTGAAGSVLDVFANSQLNHQTQVQGGVLAPVCADLLQEFFKKQRTLQQLEKLQSCRALRDDALRTPESRFAELPEPSLYVNDLPSLAGLRMHYLDAGLSTDTSTLFCVHSPKEWSYAWRSLIKQAQTLGQRIVCPDQIGFGKSDKPKRSSFHTLGWHAQVLVELMDRLDLKQVELLVSDDASELASHIRALIPKRVKNIQSVQPEFMAPAAANAPFPDNGYRAALRAFSSLKMTTRVIDTPASSS